MHESRKIVGGFMSHPETQKIFNHQLRQEHVDMVEPKVRTRIIRALNHVADVSPNFERIKPYISSGGSAAMGGSGASGGSYYLGGSLHLGGKLKEKGDNLKDNKELYHFILQLSPQEIEMLREIAAQMLGSHPSPMWGKMAEEGPEDDSEKKNLDHIVRMPNSHAMARLIEADHGYGKGGGFGKALKKVARIGSKVLKFGHHALGVVNRNKDLLLKLVPDEFKGEAEAFLETANRIDDAVNPIVDMTIDAVKQGATQEDKNKLKKFAEDKIKQVVEEKVPNGAQIIQLAKDIKETSRKPIYGE